MNKIIEGNQDNKETIIEGNQENIGITIERNQINTGATVKGQIFIKNLKYGNPETQELLDEFSAEHSYSKATLENFIKWLQKK